MDAEKVYSKYERDIKESLKKNNLEQVLQDIVIQETKGTKDLIEKLEDNYTKIGDFKIKIQEIFGLREGIGSDQFKLYPEFFDICIYEDRENSDDLPKRVENILKEGQLDGRILNDKSGPADEMALTSIPLRGFPYAPIRIIDGKSYWRTSIPSATITSYEFTIRINYPDEFKDLYNQFNMSWEKLKKKDKYLVENYASLFNECKKRVGFFDKLRLRKIKPNFEDIKIFPQDNYSRLLFSARGEFYPFKKIEDLEGN